MSFKFTLPLLLLFIIGITGCEKTKIKFGQEYVDNSYSNIILVDTLTPDLSTVYYDSIATTGTNTILAGYYNDTAFGKITAKSFFEVVPPALNDLANNAAYDSIILMLLPDKSFYGDTNTVSRLSVYQLQNELAFPSGQTSFYNTTDFAVDPIALGSVSKVIFPTRADTLFIKLSDVKGKELFDFYKSKNYVMQSNDNFLNYFKGLQLAPDIANSKSVYGFRDSVIMRLHYHETNLYREHKYLDFNYYNNGTQFNQVKSDRSATVLSVFNSTKKEVNAAATNNKAFTQTLTGLMAKVTFPTLRSLLLRGDYLKILRAELIIKPVKNSYNSFTPLPSDLYAVTTDRSNVISGTVASSGVFVNDPLFNENTSYTYDITSYVQKQILVTEANKNGLLFIPPSPAYSNRLNRIIIGDKKNSEGAIQLKLYYVSISE
jgi:preprotein translocase subunit SecE